MVRCPGQLVLRRTVATPLLTPFVAKGEQMSLSGTQSVDRRDAAVAAALCGAVVVLLAYAAGIGIQVPGKLTVAPPTAPEAPVVVPVAPAVVPLPVSQPVVQPVVRVPAPPPTAAPPHEHPQPDPTPTPRPEPPAPPTDARTCEPGVLAGTPATEPVASLLETVVRSLPLLSTLAAPPEPGVEPGLLSCVVGALVATQCCTPATTGSEAGR